MELDKVISKLRPNKEFVIYNNTLEGLQFIDSEVLLPTQDEINVAWKAIQKAENEAIIEQASARQAVLDKLGLTAEDIAALGL
jgi:sporulation protein YlmC with PRC-barrel domain